MRFYTLAHPSRRQLQIEDGLSQLLDENSVPIDTYIGKRARWQRYFAGIEAGTFAQVKDLASAAATRANNSAAALPKFNLRNVPALADIEWSVRKLSKKAHGGDQLPPSTWKCMPDLTALIIHPIALKSALLCQEAVVHSGGTYHEIKKQAATGNTCEGSRTILLEDATAKIINKPQRRILMREARHVY